MLKHSNSSCTVQAALSALKLRGRFDVATCLPAFYNLTMWAWLLTMNYFSLQPCWVVPH